MWWLLHHKMDWGWECVSLWTTLTLTSPSSPAGSTLILTPQVPSVNGGPNSNRNSQQSNSWFTQQTSARMLLLSVRMLCWAPHASFQRFCRSHACFQCSINRFSNLQEFKGMFEWRTRMTVLSSTAVSHSQSAGSWCWQHAKCSFRQIRLHHVDAKPVNTIS